MQLKQDIDVLKHHQDVNFYLNDALLALLEKLKYAMV